MNLLIWAGPVMRSHLGNPRLPPNTQVVTIGEGDGGISSTAFSRLGARVRTLRDLLYAAQARPDGGQLIELTRCETVTLAGFSAAHGLFEWLLRDPATFARVDALGAFDAYYTGNDLAVKPGYRAYCDRAAQGKALAVLTTSSNDGPGYPSSEAAVAPLVAGFGLKELPAPANIPPPVATRARSGLLWLDYGSRFTHQQHATQIAPRVIGNIVTPYLEGRKDSSPELALLSIGLLMWAANAAS